LNCSFFHGYVALWPPGFLLTVSVNPFRLDKSE